MLIMKTIALADEGASGRSYLDLVGRAVFVRTSLLRKSNSL